MLANELLAIGNPYLNFKNSETNDKIAVFNESISDALLCVAEQYAANGIYSSDSLKLLNYLKTIHGRNLNDGDKQVLKEMMEVLTSSWSDYTFINRSSFALPKGANTFALIDGRLYITPASLVFGNIHTPVTSLVTALARDVDSCVTDKLIMLTEKAGVSKEVADEAFESFTGLSAKDDVRQVGISGLAFIGVAASERYRRELGSTKNSEVITAIVLREWEEDHTEDLPIEKVLLSNALDIAEEAAKEVFQTRQQNLVSHYMELKKILTAAKEQPE